MKNDTNNGMPQPQLTDDRMDSFWQNLDANLLRQPMPEAKPAEDLNVSMGDVVKGVGSGALDLISGIGELGEGISKHGEEYKGKTAWGNVAAAISPVAKGVQAVGEMAGKGSQALTSSMSDDAQQAMHSQLISENKDENGNIRYGIGDGAGDIDVWAMKFANGIGSMIPTLASGGIVGGAARVSIGRAVTASMLKRGASEQVAKMVADKVVMRLGAGAATTTGVAGSVGSAGQNAEQIINGTSIDELMQLPSYIEEFHKIDQDPNNVNLNDQQRLEMARSSLAQRASNAAMGDPKVWAGAAAGTLLGDTMLFKMLAGKGGSGFFAGMRKGALGEGAGEAVEEGLQQYSANQAVNEAAGMNIDPMTNVVSSAVEGGLIGMGTGGAMGAVGGMRGSAQEKAQTEAEQDGTQAQPTPEQAAAGQPAPQPTPEQAAAGQPAPQPTFDENVEIPPSPEAQAMAAQQQAEQAAIDNNPLGRSKAYVDEFRDTPAYVRQNKNLDTKGKEKVYPLQETPKNGVATVPPVEGELIPREPGTGIAADGNVTLDGDFKELQPENMRLGHDGVIYAGGEVDKNGSFNSEYTPPVLSRNQVDGSMDKQSVRDSRSEIGQSIKNAGNETDSIFGPLKSLRITRRQKPFGSEKEAQLASRKDEMPVKLNGAGYGVAKIEEVEQAKAEQQTDTDNNTPVTTVPEGSTFGNHRLKVVSIGRKWVTATSVNGSAKVQVERNALTEQWKPGEVVDFHGAKHEDIGKYGSKVTFYPRPTDDPEAQTAEAKRLIRSMTIDNEDYGQFSPSELAKLKELNTDGRYDNEIKQFEDHKERRRIREQHDRWSQYLQSAIEQGRWYDKGELVLKDLAAAARKMGDTKKADSIENELAQRRKEFDQKGNKAPAQPRKLPTQGRIDTYDPALWGEELLGHEGSTWDRFLRTPEGMALRKRVEGNQAQEQQQDTAKATPEQPTTAKPRPQLNNTSLAKLSGTIFESDVKEFGEVVRPYVGQDWRDFWQSEDGKAIRQPEPETKKKVGYHGSLRRGITELATDKGPDVNQFGRGIYLTSYKDDAGDYASTSTVRNRDLIGRIDAYKKEKGISYDQAKEELRGQGGALYTVEYHYDKPLVVGDQGTKFDNRPALIKAITELGKKDEAEQIADRLIKASADGERLSRVMYSNLGNNQVLTAYARHAGHDAVVLQGQYALTRTDYRGKGVEHVIMLDPKKTKIVSSDEVARNDDELTDAESLGLAKVADKEKDATELLTEKDEIPQTVRQLIENHGMETATGVLIDGLKDGETLYLGGNDYLVAKSRSEQRINLAITDGDRTKKTIMVNKSGKQLWGNEAYSNLLRDIEGLLTVDLVNENNPFHKKSAPLLSLERSLQELNQKENASNTAETEQAQTAAQESAGATTELDKVRELIYKRLDANEANTGKRKLTGIRQEYIKAGLKAADLNAAVQQAGVESLNDLETLIKNSDRNKPLEKTQAPRPAPANSVKIENKDSDVALIQDEAKPLEGASLRGADEGLSLISYEDTPRIDGTPKQILDSQVSYAKKLLKQPISNDMINLDDLGFGWSNFDGLPDNLKPDVVTANLREAIESKSSSRLSEWTAAYERLLRYKYKIDLGDLSKPNQLDNLVQMIEQRGDTSPEAVRILNEQRRMQWRELGRKDRLDNDEAPLKNLFANENPRHVRMELETQVLADAYTLLNRYLPTDVLEQPWAKSNIDASRLTYQKAQQQNTAKQHAKIEKAFNEQTGLSATDNQQEFAQWQQDQWQGFLKDPLSNFYRGPMANTDINGLKLFNLYIGANPLKIKAQKATQASKTKQDNATDKPAVNHAVILRLRKRGESLQTKGENDLNAPRQDNTSRRLTMAESARNKARHEIELGKQISAVADGLEAGTLKALSGITDGKQIEALNADISASKYKMPDSIRQQYERESVLEKDRNSRYSWTDSATPEHRTAYIADLHEFYADLLKEVATEMQKTHGYKQTGVKLRSMINGMGDNQRYLRVTDKDMLEAIGKITAQTNSLKSSSIVGVLERIKRYERAGITTTEQLKAAAKELITISEQAKGETGPSSPLPGMMTELKRKLVNNRNSFIDFFPTPEALAQRMVDKAGITEGMRVLEPSAGHGAIADAIKEAGGKVDAVELANDLAEILKTKGHNVIGRDFLETTANGEYDAVLMNPPFSNDMDIDHVMHAYEHLKPGGTLVAIVSSMAGERSNKKNKAFAEFLQAHDAEREILPANSFSKSLNPTNVSTAMITLTKDDNEVSGNDGKTGKRVTSYTPKGKEVEVQYKAVEASNLLTSHDFSGQVNPEYPQQLQPRDRSRDSYQLQVRRIASGPEFERLSASPETDRGAPIIGNGLSNVVESGNGRTIALKQAYKEGKADDYKRKLIEQAEEYGLSAEAISAMREPVLVRERITDMDAEQLKQFVVDSNIDAKMATSATEQAKADASLITAQMMGQLNIPDGGNLLAASNMGFLTEFAKAIGLDNMNKYISSDGRYNNEYKARVANAIFAYGYDSDTLLRAVTGDTDEAGVKISNALMNNAAKMAELRELRPEHAAEIANYITEAVVTMSDARRNSQSIAEVLAQGDMLSGGVSQQAQAMAETLHEMQKSAVKMTAFLGEILNTLNINAQQNNPNQPDIFGGKGKIDKTPGEAINEAIDSREQPASKQRAELQPGADLFGASTARNDPAPSAGVHGSDVRSEESGQRAVPGLTPEEKPQPTPTTNPAADMTVNGVGIRLPNVNPEQEKTYNQATYRGRGRNFTNEVSVSVGRILADLDAKGLLETATQKELAGKLVQQWAEREAENYKRIMAYGIANPSWFITGREGKKASKGEEQERKRLIDHQEQQAKAIQQMTSALTRLMPTEKLQAKQLKEQFNQFKDYFRELYPSLKSGYTALLQSQRKAFNPKIDKLIDDMLTLNREEATQLLRDMNKRMVQVTELPLIDAVGRLSKPGKKLTAILQIEEPVNTDNKAIQDFGNVIAGAAKEMRGKLSASLTDTSIRDIINQPIGKSWPLQNYSKLITEGIEPAIVSVMRAVRESLPGKKERPFNRAPEKWANLVSKLRATTKAYLDGDINHEQAMSQINDHYRQAGQTGKALQVKWAEQVYQRVGHDINMTGIVSRCYMGRNDAESYTVVAMGSPFFRMNEVLTSANSLEQAVNEVSSKFKAALAAKESTSTADESTNTAPSKKTRLDIYQRRYTGKFYVGRLQNGEAFDLAGPFNTSREARTYSEEHRDELTATWESLKDIPSERNELNQERQGADYRNGKDVTPEQFMEAFGFNGVQFGNYVEQGRRQVDLNRAYDALMDLSKTLNINTRAISLNGKLGLAFGARGKGGKRAAAAHYEPNQIVINLTKENGAGSLAHEWWHALDNHFGRGEGERFKLVTGELMKSRYGYSYAASKYKMRSDLYGAYQRLAAALRNSGIVERSERLDSMRSKPYWGTGEEVTARAFEAYIIQKMQQNNQRNDYLANVKERELWEQQTPQALKQAFENEANPGTYPYPTQDEIAVIAKAYDEFFDTLQEQEDNGNVNLYSRSTDTIKTPMSKSEVELIAKGFVRQYKGAANIEVIVVQTQQEAEAYTQDGLPQDFTVQGFYQGNGRNRVILIADNLHSPQHALRVLRHEILVHHGLQSVIGDAEYDHILHELWKARNNPSMQDIWQHVRDVEGSNPLEVQLEEMLAYVAEEPQGKLSQFVDKLIAMIARALRKVGFYQHVTKAELRQIVNTIGERMKVVNLNAQLEKGRASNSELFSRSRAATPGERWATNNVGKGARWVINMLKEGRPLLLGSLSDLQIDQVYREITGGAIGQYQKLRTQMEADRNDILLDAETKIEPLFDALTTKEKTDLSNLMHDATMFQLHPDKLLRENTLYREKRELLMNASKPETRMALMEELDTIRENHRVLAERYAQLTDKSKALYHTLRETYTNQWDELLDAIQTRLAELIGDKAATLNTRLKEEMHAALKHGPYFPLTRFGDYVVKARKHGEYIREHFERRIDAETAVKQYKEEGYTATLSVKEDGMGSEASFNKLGLEIIKMLDGAPDGISLEEIKDDVWQSMLKMLPDASYAKHSIHRRLIKGASRDAHRAYMNNVHHFAHNITKIRYGHKMESVLTKFDKNIKAGELGKDSTIKPEHLEIAQQVLNEMNKRHEMNMNPKGQPWAAKAGTLGFLYYIGPNIASAVINMTQNFTVMLPQLGAKFGFSKASAAMAKAASDYIKHGKFKPGTTEAWQSMTRATTGLTADEKVLLERLYKAGALDLTQAHSIAAKADTDQRDVIPGSKLMRVGIRWAGALFHNAEVANREIAALAAYRLLKQADPTLTADQYTDRVTEMVYDGHGNYAASNRPRYMRGDIIKVMTQFKIYGQMMTYIIYSNAIKAAKGDKVALKTLGGVLGAHWVMAGLMGMPFPLTAAMYGIAAAFDDDDDRSGEASFRIGLSEALGKKGGDIAATGPLNYLTNLSISGRTGLDSLWWRSPDKDLTGDDLAWHYVQQMLGPVAGIGINAARGTADIGRGNVWRGMETIMPVAMRNIAKAVRQADEGELTRKGDTIIEDVSPWNEVMQAIGFSSAEMADIYEARSYIKNKEGVIKHRRSELLNDYYQAYKKQDNEKLKEVINRINAFNQSHNYGERITRKTLLLSIKSKLRSGKNTEHGVYLNENRKYLRQEGDFASDNK